MLTFGFFLLAVVAAAAGFLLLPDGIPQSHADGMGVRTGAPLARGAHSIRQGRWCKKCADEKLRHSAAAVASPSATERSFSVPLMGVAPAD
ncbi:MAG TPA: hypothetical protein VE085_00415 [Burkholderiales bacterium]|nr:hypothetical protein [Burkholderiales bacterium]